MEYSTVKGCLKDTDKDTLRGLIDRFGEDLVAEYWRQGYSLDSMEEAYQGQYRSDADFAQELAEELGSIDRNVSWPHTCIDWERASRDLMMDYFEVDGHYFRSL